MIRTCLRALALAALAIGGTVSAQTFTCPERSINYWQAFPPGGESDLSARHQQLVLKKLCPAIETVVQYKAGAGGALLWSQTNSLPADGVNVVGINLPHMVLQPMEGNVSYKTEDVTPVYWFHYTPDLLVVPESSPIRTIAEFIRVAKADPGRLNIGGSGLNSANHAAHERLDQYFGIKTTYVPYKGTGDMGLAVLGGHIDGAMTYTPFAIANKGKVRPLAVTTLKRSAVLPDIPTIDELGIRNFDATTWHGLVAPARTPGEVIATLHRALAATLADAALKKSLSDLGIDIIGGTPEEFAAYIRSEIPKWTAIVKASGAKLD